MRRLAFLLMLTSCSPVAPAPAGSDPFARELAGLVAGRSQQCISANQSQGLRVIDARTVVHEQGPVTWVNRLEDRCPALSPHNTVIVDVDSGQYCRGDHIRGLETGAIIPGPICTLRDWVPYRRR